MTPLPESSTVVYDLVVRCVVAYEQGGEAAVEQELERSGPHAEAVRDHFAAMQRSGLLQTPELPEAIGPYRVLERLGAGGMGTVFCCEQTTPVHRRVAVKVLRPGMGSHEILARFHLEQQALARLEHPGIAKVFDAGTTPGGQPYLVMEHVPGLPLQRYCDEHRLSPRARIELFVRLCDAVQHAHHKGLVHRDLKPSNVLVVTRDGEAWPVVIDFGVAKSMAGALTGSTLTMPGAMLGTPEYMSPEQAANAPDVDTRTDVYSLGVMLYELLTGTLPIPREQLRGIDVASVVQNVDPPTPSSRITTLGEGAIAIAQRRDSDVRTLHRSLRGDLDWITLKALEKEGNRRYGTPSELAADLRRHLSSEPVSAGPPTTWYRLTKLCARNRLQTTAAALVFGAIAVGLVLSLWSWRDAAASSLDAQSSLDDALMAVEELVRVGDSDLVEVPHLDEVRRDLLERAVGFYERFIERGTGRNTVLAPRVVDARLRLGRMQALLGQDDAALATLTAAVPVAAALPRAPQPSFARALLALADLQERHGDVAAARQAIAAARESLAREPAGGDELLVTMIEVRRVEARLLSATDASAALVSLAAVVALAEPLGSDPRRAPLVIHVGTDHARQLFTNGHRDQAIAELSRVRDLWQSARGANVEPAVEWRLAIAAGEIAAQFARADDYPQVLDMLTAAELAFERLTRDHRGVLAYRAGLADARSNKALAQLRNWQMQEGLATTVQAEQDHLAALDLEPGDLSLRHDAAAAALAIAQAQLEARRQRAAHDLDEARRARARADGQITQMEALSGGQAQARRLRLEERRLFAILHEPPGAPEALAALDAAMNIVDSLLAAEPTSVPLRERRIELCTRLGEARRQAGDAAGARNLLVAALAEQAEIRGTTVSNDLWQVRRRALLRELSRAEAMLGAWGRVLPLLQEYLDLAVNEDWAGRHEVLQLLLEFAAGPLADADTRPAVLARARDVVQLALAAGIAFETSGRKDVTKSMISGMRARTHGYLVAIETLAGDTRALTAALEAVAACRAEALAMADNERNERALIDACTAWGEGLGKLCDTASTVAACERMAAWFAGRKAGLDLITDIAERAIAADPAARDTLQRFLQRKQG